MKISKPLAMSRTSRPVVIIAIRHYLPGYKFGGPIRTVSNMVQCLGDEFDFRIYTSDRDVSDYESYQEVSLEQWNTVGKANVYYLSGRKLNFGDWRSILSDNPRSVLYLNSLFDVSHTLVPLLAARSLPEGYIRLVIAPRGEFSPGALEIKWWKKTPFLFLAQKIGLYKTTTWHASSESEASLIKEKFGSNCDVMVAQNMPQTVTPLPEKFEFIENPDGELTVVFLARISRMKNLEFALDVLAVTPFPVIFDIWGPVEDVGYWRDCKEIIQRLPSNIRVKYRGAVAHHNVMKVLSSYDLLFLPTLGENYGHVIAESFSVGTPVLISDRTPWKGLFSDGVGWDLPLEAGCVSFVAALFEANEKPLSIRVEWRKSVLAYAEKRLVESSISEENRKVLLGSYP